MVGEINFGLIDTSLPQKYAQPFARGQANALALQQAQQEQQMNALALQQKQQQMADESITRSIYKQVGGDLQKAIPELQKAGQFKQAAELQTQIHAQNKAKMDDAIGKLDVMKRLSSDVIANPTLENAINSLDQFKSITGSDVSQELSRLQAIGNNPLEIKKWAAGHALTAEHFMPKAVTIDAGGKQITGFQDPVSGTFTQTGEIAKTQTEESKATERTAAAQRAQAASQFSQTQALEREKMGAKAQGIAETAKEQAKAKMQLPQIESSAQMALQNIDDLLTHPGFSQSVGAGIGHATKFIPGTNAADFNARLEQLQGGAFLQAFNALKGGGQITEIEGNKATHAITRMSTAQSEKEFRKAADEFKSVIQTGLDNARKSAGVQPSPKSSIHPAEIQDLINKYGG